MLVDSGKCRVHDAGQTCRCINKLLVMKRTIVFLLVVFGFLLGASAQDDPASIMEEGRKLEQRMKETEAIEKYRQVVLIQPSNLKALVKLVELNIWLGSKATDPIEKARFYNLAKDYAASAWAQDSTGGETNYAMALVYGRLAEVEKKKEIVVGHIKTSKQYANRSVLAAEPVGKAYNILGRWHYDMLQVNAIKKAAVKLVYGSFPESSIDSAIVYFEKCRQLEPYYCQNFLDLGKAYNQAKKYEKSIAALQQLAKLPVKRQEDAEIKKEGAELLQALQ